MLLKQVTRVNGMRGLCRVEFRSKPKPHPPLHPAGNAGAIPIAAQANPTATSLKAAGATMTAEAAYEGSVEHWQTTYADRGACEASVQGLLAPSQSRAEKSPPRMVNLGIVGSRRDDMGLHRTACLCTVATIGDAQTLGRCAKL